MIHQSEARTASRFGAAPSQLMKQASTGSLGLNNYLIHENYRGSNKFRNTNIPSKQSASSTDRSRNNDIDYCIDSSPYRTGASR